jgi:hypothetical protein
LHNAGRYRSALRIAVVCGCLFLAVCVFAWGLHAKLSLYDAQVGTSTASAAKLLLSQKTGRDLVASPAGPASPDLRIFSLALFAAVLVIPLLRVQWLRPEIVRGRPQDRPWHSTIFSRPPPVPTAAR